uniref:Uncharacterized protein n=1 Tax=Anguilla anguilla TaxID=7936 RepID=A0A0E9WPU4_ANGAN
MIPLAENASDTRSPQETRSIVVQEAKFKSVLTRSRGINTLCFCSAHVTCQHTPSSPANA